jgi:hypothetical protein
VKKFLRDTINGWKQDGFTLVALTLVSLGTGIELVFVLRTPGRAENWADLIAGIVSTLVLVVLSGDRARRAAAGLLLSPQPLSQEETEEWARKFDAAVKRKGEK